MKTVISLIVCVPLLVCGQNTDFDWDHVYHQIQSSVASKSSQSEEFSEQLETWYAELGAPIKIDMPRENFGYMLALVIACNPDLDLEKLRLAEGNKFKTRRELFQQVAKQADCQSIPFDKIKWTSLAETSSDRYKMIKSYLQDNQVIGSTVESIKNALGSPTSDSKESLSYCLGPDPSTIGPDSVWIHFQVKNDSVIAYSYRGE